MRHRVSLFFTLLFCIFSQLGFAYQQLIIEPDMGRTPITKTINQATSSIDLVMYGFTDLAFTDALTKAQRQHKTVRVLLEQHPFRADSENLSAIHHLRENNILLHWPDKKFKLTHQKTFIVDDDTAIVMTLNLTRSSFSKERNFALLITDPAIIKEISAVFAADWEHQNYHPNNPNLIWSPDNSREKILALIRQAKSDIKIYAEGLSDYQIIGALAKAARSGVKVTILTSAYSNQPINKKFDYLINSGANIRYSKNYVIHAKVIIIDNTSAVLGSINLTKQSLDSNRELSIITQDPKVMSQLIDTFKYDELHTTTRAVTPSTSADSTAATLKNIKKIMTLLKHLNNLHFN